MNGLLEDSLDGRVAVLTLNAPEKRNAISVEMREAVIAALQQRFLDDDCSAIVITGAGGNFSSGGDIKGQRPAPEAVARELRQKLGRLQEMVRLITSSPKPVVAAVDGKAFGAGMSLAVACDAVIASDSAQFCAAFGRVGLLPDAGILYTLPRRIGPARAQHLLLSAHLVKAPEALDMGLVDAMVPSADLVARASEEALCLASIAPLSFAAIKSLGCGGCTTLEAAFAAEMRMQPGLALTQDYQEARTAFGEKRKPNFRGC